VLKSTVAPFAVLTSSNSSTNATDLPGRLGCDSKVLLTDAIRLLFSTRKRHAIQPHRSSRVTVRYSHHGFHRLRFAREGVGNHGRIVSVAAAPLHRLRIRRSSCFMQFHAPPEINGHNAVKVFSESISRFGDGHLNPRIFEGYTQVPMICWTMAATRLHQQRCSKWR
jgi:hypothetical protein